MTMNSKLSRLFKTMPMTEACELHIRLQEGKADQETRTMLRKALRKCESFRGMEAR